jgi:DNA-binding LytR/AlgR family response regulator
MKLRCAIVDDESLSIDILQGYLCRIPNIEVVATFNDPISVVDFLNENQVDFLFLDIEMPNLSGIDLLKSLVDPPLVIITSANKNYALEGYELDVVDYLLKPISLKRLLRSVSKISDIVSVKTTSTASPSDEFIFLKENKRMVRVNFRDILFVEGMKDYVKVVTRDKTVISKQNLSSIEVLLADKNFVRVHKSYIVSLDHIDAYSCSFIEIGLFEIPIGRSHKDKAMEQLGLISDIEKPL